MSAGHQQEQAITLGTILASELQFESISLRKMLARIPSEQFSWKPHEKSMPLLTLARHIVEVIDWTRATVKDDGLDFAAYQYQPKEYVDAAELVADFDANLAEALAELRNSTDAELAENWTLRSGEHIIFTQPKAATMRTFVMNHFIHHRGQLSVYLRLLDIPVPSIYGPSADETA